MKIILKLKSSHKNTDDIHAQLRGGYISNGLTGEARSPIDPIYGPAIAECLRMTDPTIERHYGGYPYKTSAVVKVTPFASGGGWTVETRNSIYSVTLVEE